MGILDWDLIWNNEIALTSRRRLDNGRFWDEVAAKGRDTDIPRDTTQRQVSLISPSNDRSILEIGPGPGRLTIPLAKLSSHLTAVDHSEHMLERLRRRAEEEGIENISYMNMNWADLEPSMLDHQPDMILASYSLFMMDIGRQLKRMNDIAKEKVILFLPGEPRIPRDLQEILFGAAVNWGLSDHVILFNILHDQGIDANVEIMNYRSRKAYGSPDEAARELASFHNAPIELIPSLARYLDPLLTEENGIYFLDRDRRTAAIWWWTV
jgi:SAM-dependent methyltransferase